MPDEQPLALEISQTDDSATIRCSGRLISTTAADLRAQVKPLIGPSRRIVLDLTDLTFMDSMGLGTIATLWVSSKNAGCQLALINLSPRIRDLFTVTHLLSLFESCGEANARIP